METPSIKKILYIGSRDTELVKSIQNLLQGRNDVAVDVMERNDLNVAEDRAKSKVIKWKEAEKMSEYIRNPFNVKACIEKGEKLYELIKEMKAIEEFTSIMEKNKGTDVQDMTATQIEAIREQCRVGWNGWFTLKEAVEATNMNYKTAAEVLELLYAFGFLAFREKENVKYHTILLNSDMQLRYIGLLIEEKQADIVELQMAVKSIEAKVKAENKAKKTKEVASDGDERPATKKTTKRSLKKV